MTRDPKLLLPGYATDSLDEAERGDLLRAALDDQALFDGLLEEEGIRELLQDPAARQELLAVLEQPTAWERLRAWFERPATLLDLGAVAGLVLAGFLGFALVSQRAPSGRSSSAAQPFGTPLSADRVTTLLALPAHEAVPADLEIVRRPDAVYAPGDPVHLRLSFRAPARVALLYQPPGGAGRQAWPGLGQPPALVAPPDTGGPAMLPVTLEAPAVAGVSRLRLVVAPADLDLGALDASGLAAASARLTLVDLRYEVKRP